ncbi:hypothetical protein [Brucella pituitosa]|nr:hypothetical protein [Brucella pituitosa]
MGLTCGQEGQPPSVPSTEGKPWEHPVGQPDNAAGQSAAREVGTVRRG